eukprot:TRINITY_DN5335_c0_g1_i1.p1 TRINITY_DN5335_c0_g1~~TRINITY_DN5335_c0_g1_i1.p1  ORF type:complete len:538 (-),score=96.47 TRINITY_DN5335_c0_g1_i1:397-2010(-)
MEGEDDLRRDGIEALCVGRRVYSKEKGPCRTGTVKYIGDLQGYEGTWIGVDWDDGDGRHDGTVNGVRYFKASGDKSASFVRPKALCTSITFLDALFRRYKAEPPSKEEQDEMYVLSTSQKRVAIELVGLNKIQERQRQIENLVHVSLAYAGIGEAGPTQHTRDLLSNLQELDLRGNLLSDWQAIASICEQLPLLRVLDISNNHISNSSNCLPIMQNLRTLVLNNCQINWGQVEMLKDSLPFVEELHLDSNKIDCFRPLGQNSGYVEGFSQLRVLSLEDNDIESWNEIMKLSQLIRLEQLRLNNNKIKYISYSAQESIKHGFKPFQNLRCLLIGGNEISDWASLDSLNSFPSLTDVRLSDNPISNPTMGGASRYILVARLGKILMLNGSQVTQKERKDSEIRYVRMVMNTTQGKSHEEIARCHPRFSELKALHDVPEIATLEVHGPQKLAAGLVSINLTYVGARAGEKAPITKKLPATMTIAKLKVLCEGFFKLNPSKQKLFLQDKDSPVPTLLTDDTETLMDVGLGHSGGTILVDEV